MVMPTPVGVHVFVSRSKGVDADLHRHDGPRTFATAD